MGERIEIQVALVHGREFSGRASRLTVPRCDMSVKDLREYLLKCARGEDGTSDDQNKIKHLLETCGVDEESIKSDPIQIRESISGTFMEKDIPNWPVLDRMHVLFLHPTPLN